MLTTVGHFSINRMKVCGRTGTRYGTPVDVTFDTYQP